MADTPWQDVLIADLETMQEPYTKAGIDDWEFWRTILTIANTKIDEQWKQVARREQAKAFMQELIEGRTE